MTQIRSFILSLISTFSHAVFAASGLQHQLDQRVGARLLVELAAGLDNLFVLRRGNRQPGHDAADAPRFLFEIPDEFASGALPRVAFPVLREYRDARTE